MAIAFLCDCSLSLGRYSLCPFLPRYCSFSLVVWGVASTRSAPRSFLSLTRFARLHPCLFFTSLLWVPLAAALSLWFGRGYSVYLLPWLVPLEKKVYVVAQFGCTVLLLPGGAKKLMGLVLNWRRRSLVRSLCRTRT